MFVAAQRVQSEGTQARPLKEPRKYYERCLPGCVHMNVNDLLQIADETRNPC